MNNELRYKGYAINFIVIQIIYIISLQVNVRCKRLKKILQYRDIKVDTPIHFKGFFEINGIDSYTNNMIWFINNNNTYYTIYMALR